MGYWKDILSKDDKHCFQEAFLEVRDNKGIKKLPFKYSTINDDTIVNTESALPMTYDKRTKAIYVRNTHLPFINGARVVFKDNTSMVVSSIIKVIDEQKALSDGEGVIGLNIYLGG